MTYIYKNDKVEFEYDVKWGLNIEYSESLKLLHPHITWCSVYIGDYQGDVISIGYDKDMNWYYKMNGYGSCSGCDWVESIDDEKGAIEFFKNQETVDSIGNDKEKVKEYLRNEIKNVYSFEEKHYEELAYFIDNLKEKENEE